MTMQTKITPRPRRSMAQKLFGAVNFGREIDDIAAQGIFALFGVGVGICIGVLLWLAFDNAADRARADVERAVVVGAW